jgi:hypothetical protein
MNIADSNFAMWNTVPVIDVLMQMYGDDTLYNADGSGKTITFREGALGTELPVSAGTIPAGGHDGRWNWMLFTLTNVLTADGVNRYVGYVPDATKPGVQNGGVNGGTLRIEGLPGISIRAVALGPQGSFGTSNQVNVFLPPIACDPEPQTVNLAFIDLNAGITNHLSILNDTDQTVTYGTGGPAGDIRKAVQATGSYMNFGILSNYLGEPCNPNRPMKVCVEFYDDPNLAGNTFGPDQYASDNVGDTKTFGGPLYMLAGSGAWVRVAFWIPSVNLAGVNTAPLTGGPRLIFNGPAVWIDRVELGVVRSGTGPLAGQDPDPTFFMNPAICTTNYGWYAELELGVVTNNLLVAGSGGDQNMLIEMAGPTNDQRLAVRPDLGNNNLQFGLQNTIFGPAYQDNADVTMSVTYYDDPTMIGATLRPQVYSSWIYGVSTITFPQGQYNTRATLTGSGKWVTAYFELPNVNFNGVNLNYSVVRWQTTAAVSSNSASGYVHVSRVRYDVVRPCGQGINLFQTIGITNAPHAGTVGWFGTATLQAAPAVTGVYTNVISITNAQRNSFTPAAPRASQFFRLLYPPLPPPPAQ